MSDLARVKGWPLDVIRRSGISLITVGLLTACGGAVTPQPTTELPPASTPTITPTFTPRPTATVPFIPPPGAPTPTVTPTPIVCVVDQGDTLRAIALEYGVSVEALQKVNAIENPQLLQIGQRLIIPTGEETGDTSPDLLLPTPTPQSVEVQGTACYRTLASGLQCLGEIVNTTAVTLTNTLVRVALLDASGERLAETDALTAGDLVPPGRSSPFRVLFEAPPAGWAGRRASVIRSDGARALSDSYVPIAVTETRGQSLGSRLQVSGTVRNASAEKTAGGVSVIATAYDAAGHVVGFRLTDLELEGTLAPGAEAPFRVLLTSYGEALADFDVAAVGHIPAE